MHFSYLALWKARLRHQQAWKIQLFRESFSSTDRLYLGCRLVLGGSRLLLASFSLSFLYSMLGEFDRVGSRGLSPVECGLMVISVFSLYTALAGKLLCLSAPAGRPYLVAYWVALMGGPFLLISSKVNSAVLGFGWLLMTSFFLTFLAVLCHHFQWNDLTRRWRRLTGMIWVAGLLAAGSHLTDQQMGSSLLGIGSMLASFLAIGIYLNTLAKTRTRLGEGAQPLRYRPFFSKLWAGLKEELRYS